MEEGQIILIVFPQDKQQKLRHTLFTACGHNYFKRVKGLPLNPDCLNFKFTNFTMSPIKTQLKKLIDDERDVNVLKAIKTLLEKTNSEIMLKEKLTSRALKSERDIKEGRVLTKRELIKRTNQLATK